MSISAILMLQVPQWSGPCSGAEYEAAVDRVHADYCAALQRLWEQHKDTYAPSRRSELRIVE